MSQIRRGNRLVFANQLRGIAAMLVAISHLVGVFWAMRAFIGPATFSPVQPGPFPTVFWWISYRWVEFGPFGVALFFLISGLVIPFSLEKHTRWTFFFSRLLRIYPMFILVLLMEALVLYLASKYWRIPFTYTVGDIVSNCLLLSSVTGHPDIDFVNWTLSIEIKFYVLMTLAAPLIRNGKVWALFAISISIFVANFALSRRIDGTVIYDSFTFLHGISLESPYLIFMLIGVLFNFHDRRFIGYRILGLSVLCFAGLFVWSWRLGFLRSEYPIVTANYLEAIVVFGGLYLFRSRIPEIKALDFMAMISFPFYLIHAVLGFVILKYLIVALHFNYYAALGCALSVIVGIALLLHFSVEITTINFGRALAERRQTVTVFERSL